MVIQIQEDKIRVQKKIPYDVSHIISTNAVEAYPLYDAGTSYAKDDIVYYGWYDYVSLVNSNVGNTPDISPTKWLRSIPVNSYAMFDEQVSSQTVSPSPLTVVIKPNTVVDSFAILNLSATSYRVEMKDGVGGTSVYDTGEVSLNSEVIVDYSGYFFSEFEYITDVVITDLPLFYNGTIYLTVTNSTGDCKVGVVTYGRLCNLGETQYGASFSINSYSVKDTDEFGTTTFVRRANSKRQQAEVFVDNNRLAYLYKTLVDIESVPSVWIGSTNPNYTPLIVYGYYKNFNNVISYPSHSMCSIEIDGLI